MSDIEKYNDYLSFILTISTTMLAVGVSVFTLTTAFIVNKRDALKEINDDIQNGGVSLTLAKRIKNAQIFIARMKNITNKSIWLMAVSLATLIGASIFKLFTPTNCVHILFVGIITIFFLLLLCMLQLCRWYLNNK